MPAERTTMRQVREVLRLKFVGGVPIREIARRIGVAASTARATVRRFQAAGLCWPLPDELTDAVLEAKLFADAGTKQGYRRQIEPAWASIHRELKRKHVTLSILWDEIRRAISRIGTPPTNFNRRTSRTWRMIVLSAGIRSLLWTAKGADLSRPAEAPDPRARSSRNGGRHHLGTVGEIISEWVGGIIPE